MILERKAVPALAAGVLLAVAAAGCASQDTGAGRRFTGYDESGPTHGYGSTTTEARGNRNNLMATIDDQTTRDIENALRAANGVDSRDITVRTLNGHVALSGTVGSEAERERALEVARGTDVEHVVNVQDNLRVAG
ncbi:MAG TPA: BON domain-containing protein [Usitatibacter sp.]|nr:BON domain-containing protein [Usitatibacter sp.]